MHPIFLLKFKSNRTLRNAPPGSVDVNPGVVDVIGAPRARSHKTKAMEETIP